MKRTSTFSVFATTYAVVLVLTLLYAAGLSMYHGNLMYLRLWGSLLIVACFAALVVLLFSGVVAFAINSSSKGR